ncbi:unnamed protein product [Trichogramma brassicae]|uniref:Uncharacterized protein n=1 Tax=Trichogramma brassicae TaxID=86971 RepID=A0A6H5I4Y1_9HYME|nr:unnamed protein product [Trichogramma brassicae]
MESAVIDYGKVSRGARLNGYRPLRMVETDLAVLRLEMDLQTQRLNIGEFLQCVSNLRCIDLAKVNLFNEARDADQEHENDAANAENDLLEDPQVQRSNEIEYFRQNLTYNPGAVVDNQVAAPIAIAGNNRQDANAIAPRRRGRRPREAPAQVPRPNRQERAARRAILLEQQEIDTGEENEPPVLETVEDHEAHRQEEENVVMSLNINPVVAENNAELGDAVGEFEASMPHEADPDTAEFVPARVDIQRSPQSGERGGFESGGALSQIVATIGDPRSSRRRLYANVIDSILLYGSPIWSCGTETQAVMRRAEAIHRRACLRFISCRPHLSYEATYVLVSIPPLALLADERS